MKYSRIKTETNEASKRNEPIENISSGLKDYSNFSKKELLDKVNELTIKLQTYIMMNIDNINNNRIGIVKSETIIQSLNEELNDTNNKNFTLQCNLASKEAELSQLKKSYYSRSILLVVNSILLIILCIKGFM